METDLLKNNLEAQQFQNRPDGLSGDVCASVSSLNVPDVSSDEELLFTQEQPE